MSPSPATPHFAPVLSHSDERRICGSLSPKFSVDFTKRNMKEAGAKL